MLEFFASVPSSAYAAFFTPLLLALLLRAGRKPVDTGIDGWTRLENTWGVTALGILCLPFAIAFVFASVSLFLDGGSGESPLILLLFLPLIALFLYGPYQIFLTTTRFSDKGIMLRRGTRERFIPWGDVTEVKDSVFWGTYMRAGGGRIPLIKFRRGFREMLRVMARHKVKGAKELLDQEFT
jgi:hypothetical protein